MAFEIFMPDALEKGDKIALVSPASAVKEEYVYGAVGRIVEYGYEPVIMPHAIGHEDGNFASAKSSRLLDLFDALENPEFKAILCTRGGYGCCQLLGNFSFGMISRNPKWIIGFSDISALHAMWLRSAVGSVHGPMTKHLSQMPADDPCTRALFNLLENGGRFDYTFESHPYNREGYAKGVLRGGNLAVLNDLASTPYDILSSQDAGEVILFIEDINEPIYKVNRILWRLFYAGVFMWVKGIIFGRFSDYYPDKNYGTMEDMIKTFIDHSIMPFDLPVVYDFPVGHCDLNYPLTEGARVELEVSGGSVSLRTTF